MRFWAAFSWTLFNVTLAAWWLVYGLQHTAGDAQRAMLISEGLILILSLFLGGLALLYYMRKEQKRALEVREFFATFSHEIKTSIASLRLQVESLAEDFKGTSSPLMERLVSDSVRLEIQLENSLSLSQLQSSSLYLEEVSVNKMILSFQHHWPNLQFKMGDEIKVWADRRALETVLRNIIQNAILHGQTQEIQIQQKLEGQMVRVSILDRGLGFRGDRKNLGKLFFRHNSRSGSGVGLHLIASLVKKMGGTIEFPENQTGFEVSFKLKRVG